MAFNLSDNDPFDSSQPNYAPETPKLEDIMLQATAQAALKLRVALPAKILSVTADQTVDVLPLLQTRFMGRAPEDMAALRAVPVLVPQGAAWRMSMPLAVGDTGLCVFVDRNIDTFIASDGQTPQDPQDNRAHDLSDAVFIPGLVPAQKQTTDTGSDLVLGNGQLQLRLRKDGKISIKNQGAEIIDLLDKILSANVQLAQQLQNALVLTAFGPAGFIQSSILAFLQTQQSLQALQSQLETFKSDQSSD